MMDKTNSKTVPTPLFEASTAYKTILDIKPDNNNLYALYIYAIGGLVQIYKNDNLGIEKYQFANQEYCNTYYNLLNKIKSYELFLANEVVENAKVFSMLQPSISAFSTKYGGKFQEQTKRERRKCNRALSGIETLDVPGNAFAGYHPIVIKQDSNDLVCIVECTPVFKTAMVCEPQSDYYVYQLKLIESICRNGSGFYSQQPCIHISLFDNRENADAYKEYMDSESEKFQNYPMYPDIEKQCYPALQRFDKYMGKSR